MEPPRIKDEGESSSKSNVNIETSQKSEAHRRAMHEAIDKKDINKVEQYLKEVKYLRQWLNPEGRESALRHALRNRLYRIYALLGTYGCTLSEENRTQEENIFSELSLVQERECMYQLRSFIHKYRPTSYIVQKSSSKTSRDDFETRAKELYEKLDMIPLVSTILRVVATAFYLEIIFDFESEHVDNMLGPTHKTTRGLTLFVEQEIYIGGKRGFSDLLGTIAHEFSHLALHLVYRNGGKPYKAKDKNNEGRYQHILKGIKERMREKKEETLDTVIRGAFSKTYVEENKVEQELIVRVPHALAEYSEGSAEGTPNIVNGEELLKQQVPDLFEYFLNVTIPHMEEYIEECRPQRDQYEIEKANLKLNTATKLQDLRIEFERTHICNLVDKPLHVLSAPDLSFYEVMIEEIVRSTDQSYLFLATSQWGSTVEEAVEEYKCHFIVLSNKETQLKEKLGEQQYNDMLDWLNELSADRETRVVVLTENKNDQLVKDLRKQDSFRDEENVHVDTFSDSGYHLVTRKCKSEKLRSSDIHFQDLETKLEGYEIWNEEDAEEFLKALDETTFLTLCQDKKVKVGPKLPRLDKNALSCYIERTCKRAIQVKLCQALSNSRKEEAFAIVECSEENICRFLPRCVQVRHYSHVEIFEKCLLLDNARNYEALVQSKFYRDKIVHLLRYDTQSSQFRWIKSNGCLSHLPKKTSSARVIPDTKTLLGENPEKVMAICGHPGTGKSATSLRMAQDIKALNVKTCVIHVNVFKRVGREDVSAMKDLGVACLAKLCGLYESTFEFNLLQQSAKSAKPFEVVVIFDAFDEVDAAGRKFVLDLVDSLRKTKISKLLLFSRNSCKSEIEDRFHTMAFELVPFNLEEQRQFLEHFSKRNGHELNHEFFLWFRQMSCTRSWSQEEVIAGNPLFIKMYAEIIEKHTEFDIEKLRGDMFGPIVTVLYLYERFVELKIDNYMTSLFGPLNKLSVGVQALVADGTKNLYENHGLLALKDVFDNESLQKLLTETELEKLKPEGALMKDEAEGRLKQGFVDGHRKGIPVFMHKTFAEFFAARYLAQKLRAKTVNSDVLMLLAGMYRNIDYGGVLYFFDAMGAKSHAPHCRIMNKDTQSIQEAIEINSLDAFGRTPLHIAALHEAGMMSTIHDRVWEEILVEFFDTTDKLGITPFMYICQRTASYLCYFLTP